MFYFTNICQAVGLKSDSGRFCKSIHYFKTDIMSGFGILAAGITKTCNKVFQGCLNSPSPKGEGLG